MHKKSWRRRPSHITAKSRKLVGLLYTQFYKWSSLTTLSRLYTSLVKTPSWTHCTPSNILFFFSFSLNMFNAKAMERLLAHNALVRQPFRNKMIKQEEHINCPHLESLSYKGHQLSWSVQRFAIKVCLKQWNTPYCQLLNQSHLSTHYKHFSLCYALCIKFHHKKGYTVVTSRRF